MPPTTDPTMALRNRLDKDRLFAERVRRLAVASGFDLISVDGSRSPDDIRVAVERSFASVLEVEREPVDLRPVRR